MTPDRMAGLVIRWVRFYTRELPATVARRRVGEIVSDLHDHIAHERACGVDDRRITFGIASRLLRGVAADAAWRRRQAKVVHPSTREEMMKARKPLYVSAVRIALSVLVILSLPLVAMLLSNGATWSVADFVLAAVLLALVGISFELAARKSGSLFAALGIAALGIAAAVFGESDDAPGLVLVGILLVAGACAIGVRRVQHGK